MPDFEFLQNPISKKWVILAPRRADRPDVAKGVAPVCPFCIGNEEVDTSEVVLRPRHTSEVGKQTDWLVSVVPNKFPFAPIHEVIVHSPDHHKNFGELPLSQVELIFDTYRQRYNAHKDKGQVYIFHNRGEAAGESLPHPHTQLVVVPKEVEMDMPTLDSVLSTNQKISPSPPSSPLKGEEAKVVPSPLVGEGQGEGEVSNFKFRPSADGSNFSIFCSPTSQWPDEVWIAPKKRARLFGDIADEEVTDLSWIITRLVEIFSLRHGMEFPFNFHIYPGADWYLRLIPRTRVLGGFELGTGIFINTQDPKETIKFIKDHFVPR